MLENKDQKGSSKDQENKGPTIAQEVASCLLPSLSRPCQEKVVETIKTIDSHTGPGSQLGETSFGRPRQS